MITIFFLVLLVSFAYIGCGAVYIYYTEKALGKPIEMWVQLVMLIMWPIFTLLVLMFSAILYLAEKLKRSVK